MRVFLLAFILCFAPQLAFAGAATKSFEALRGCVMKDDAPECRKFMYYTSYSLFDRFAKYKLIQCLPTNFTIDSEKKTKTHTVITASMPASHMSRYKVKLAFTPDAIPLLDVLASLRLAFGDKWQYKVNLAEQLYLMMKRHMGSGLTCDQLEPLLQ